MASAIARLRSAFISALVLGATLTAHAQQPIAGPNVNMVRGTKELVGDPFLQRQNEPSIAVSTRNPCHLLAGANDYRTVDIPDSGALPGDNTASTAAPPAGPPAKDAWLGWFKSFDCGATWRTGLLPGYPQDTSQQGMASPLKGVGAGADSTVRSGTNGMFFFSGMVFNRVDNGLSKIFVSRFIDDNNNEKGDSIRYLGAVTIETGTKGQFADKPWLAVDIPRNGFGPKALPWVASDDGAHQSTAELADAAGTVCDIPADPVRGIPAQHFPAGNVYMAWTRFEGNGTPNPSKIMFARSTDCGKTFKGGPVSNNQKTSQGAALAIAPSDGTVYLAWREFAKNSRDHAIWITKSTDGGKSFEKPRAVADVINPFDQPKSTTRFRTNSLPTIAVDHVGRVYVAWSERGFATGRPDPLTGDARIVMAVSTDGAKTFKTRYPIADRPVPGSHQVMPALRFTAGKLQIIFYDFGNDIANHPGQYVDDAGLSIRHTVDVSAATASPADKPIFQDFLITPEGTSPRISQYRTLKDPNTGLLQQVQFNPANLPLYVDGSTPFLGDYIDVAGLDFVPQRQGTTDVWQPNLGSINFTGGSLQSSSSVNFPLLPVYHATWTDHRDVKAPPDGNWQNYVPPGMGGAFCDPSKAGMRNANIYTSRLTTGLYVGSPGNTKPLGFTSIDNGPQQHIQRGFVVFLQNTTKDKIAKRYLVHIANQPGPVFGDRATFLQNPRPPYVQGTPLPPPQTWRIVAVPPLSTVARTVYVTATNPNAQVRIEVAEIVPTTPSTTLLEGTEDQLATLGPQLAAGGLRTSILLNPDASNPPIIDPDFIDENLPSVTSQEDHDPFIFDSLVTSISNVKTSLLEIRTPSNPDEGNKVETPDEGNPDEGNPDEGNPDEGNPDEGNAGLLNTALGDNDLASASISDVQWKVQNKGNTISAFKFRPAYKGDRTGKRFQLFVTRRYYAPTIDPLDCKLIVHRSNQVVVNVADYKPRNPDEGNPDEGNPDEGNPDEGNPDEGNASFMLSPGDTATVTLRVYDTGAAAPPVEGETKKKAAALMSSYATNTTQTTPTSVVAGPDLLVLGAPQLSVSGIAPAGTLTVSWTLKNRGTSATTETFNNRYMLHDVTGLLPDREASVLPFSSSVPFDNPATPAIEGEVTVTDQVTIPRTVPPGNYVLYVVANYLEHQVEADVHNNVSTTSVPLTVAFSLSLAFATQPSLTTQDFLMTPAVRVAVLDGVNAPVGAAEVPQVTLTLGGPAAVLGGTLTQPNVNGIATFNDLHIHNVANGYFLNAMAPKSFNTTSTNFSIKVDSPPVAVAESYQTDEDVAIQTGNAGSGLPPGTEANDIDEILNGPGTAPPGRHLTAILVNGPSHAATFSLAADGNFNYVPAANYNGPDSFSYKVNDALVDSNTVVVSITVRPVNDMPTATPQSVTTAEDATVSFTLTGADIESAANLAFNIVAAPAHGTLSAPPNVTYTPNANYNGPDSFTFTVTDRGDPDNCGAPVSAVCTAALTSAPATVTITVQPVNDMPTATPQSVTTAEDAPLSFTLTGADIESAANLSFAIVTAPQHGTLSAPPNVSYTPNANYNGPDSFTFTVTDRGDPDNCGALSAACTAALTSAPSTVSITVQPVNDMPTATPQSVTTAEDAPMSFTLTGADMESPAANLSFAIVTAPSHGTLSAPPNVTYTPNANYNGPDSFTFTVTDRGDPDNCGAASAACAAALTSAAATVSMTVLPVNDVPAATAQSVTTAEDEALLVALAGTDVESAASLTFTIVTPPSHGTLSAPNFTYTPAADYNGQDSFTFTVTDRGDPDNCGLVSATCTATLTSAPATVTITVTEANDPPVGIADVLSDVQKNSAPRAISILSLLANDSAGPADESGQTLTIASVSGAVGGTVALGGADVVFTPAADFSGPASFVYTLQDNGTTAGAADFKTATVTVSFTITVDTAADLVAFGVQPTNVVQGVAIDPAVTVTVHDATDAPISGAEVSMMVSPGFETTATAGGEQSGIAVDTTRNRYYVANRTGSTVTAIDASTNTAIATVPVSAQPSGVAVDEGRNRIYVSSAGLGQLDIINGATWEVTHVSVGASASQVDVDPALGHVYVGHDDATGDVTVLSSDLPYGTLGTLAGSGNVLAVRVNPGNHRVYVLTSTGLLRIFDGSTAPFALIDSVPSFGAQGSIAVDSATNRIWVTDGRSGGTNFTVRVFDGTTHEVVTSFLGPKGPQGIAIDAVRRRVFYGAYWDPAALVEVDADTYTVLSTTTMGNIAATALAVNPATHRIYVGHDVDTQVGVFTYPELQGGTSVTTDAIGVATFANLSILDVATGYRLRASSSGVLSAPSNSFNVTPPPEPLAAVIVMAAGPVTPGVTPAVKPLLIPTASFTPSQ